MANIKKKTKSGDKDVKGGKKGTLKDMTAKDTSKVKGGRKAGGDPSLMRFREG
jgi:hypothetical protein